MHRAFSLQPQPLIAADQHYRDVLHNKKNHSDPWFLELLASQAAIIADCHYALGIQPGDKAIGKYGSDAYKLPETT